MSGDRLLQSVLGSIFILAQNLQEFWKIILYGKKCL